LARGIEHLRNYWRAMPRITAAEVAWMALFGESAGSVLGTVLSRASTVVQANTAAARWRDDPDTAFLTAFEASSLRRVRRQTPLGSDR
jgi:hypothetical protein